MKKFEDDGRTIADMNIEGTPWYRKNLNEQEDGEDFSDLSLKKLIWQAYKKFFLAVVILGALLFGVLLAVNYLWLG